MRWFLVQILSLFLVFGLQLQGAGATSAQTAPIPPGQKAIIEAQEAGVGLHFVDVTDVQVIRLLPDDLKGSTHQKWVVRLANGRNVMAVYNTDICDRVPLKVGDRVSMGGQYIYERGGGLIHWLHEDPIRRRPHGYVDVNGARYGKVDPDKLRRQQDQRRDQKR